MVTDGIYKKNHMKINTCVAVTILQSSHVVRILQMNVGEETYWICLPAVKLNAEN